MYGYVLYDDDVMIRKKWNIKIEKIKISYIFVLIFQNISNNENYDFKQLLCIINNIFVSTDTMGKNMSMIYMTMVYWSKLFFFLIKNNALTYLFYLIIPK